jgi:pantoate--beta-alanine ligase
MGYLHDGHLSLVSASKARDDATVVSIFVNPAQFGPNEDFARYPRNEAGDLALLEARRVDAVYLPAAVEMYPEGYQTYVNVEQVTLPLEGAARPGHFRGVATVVLKLFNTTEPDRAYFGRKDAQQLRVVRRMVRDLDLPVEVIGCPIVREPDGLAMSSRNVYLTPEERKAAPVIFRSLDEARHRFEAGVRDVTALREITRRLIAGASHGEVEYVSLADDDSLEELDGAIDRAALLSVVVRFGKTRLLDNLELHPA